MTMDTELDFDARPVISLNGDTARTRRNDRVTSHRAADRSQRNIHAVRVAVLQIVIQEGPIVGSEINRLYQLRGDRNGWPHVHIDSPRKRAGDLERDGLLRIVNPDHIRGTEAEYEVVTA